MTKFSVKLILSILGLAIGLAPVAAARDAPLATPLERLQVSERVDPAILSELEGDRAALVTVYFVRADDSPEYAAHPARGTDVGPLLFDLVTMSEGTDSRLDDHGSVLAFTGKLRAGAIAGLLDDPYVLSIDRAKPTPTPGRAGRSGDEGPSSITAASHSCSPSSTKACFLSNRFAVQVTQGGSAARVAASGSASAAFWRYSSSNWEVLVKVLDGCSINGHYWVFAAGATSVSWSFSVEDTANDLLLFFPGSCPVTNTTAFDC
jgi:hypothetical protein